MTKYKTISDGIEAKIVNGKAYVRVTNMVHGGLEQGGRINRIYRQSTQCKTVEALQKPCNDYGTTMIDFIINDPSNIIRYGNKIK